MSTRPTSAPPGNFIDGTNIYGIEWKNNYSELSIIITNDTNVNYTDLDIYIRTDMMIAAGGIAPGVNQCFTEGDIPGLSVAGQRFTVHGMEGGPLEIPLFNMQVKKSSIYRIRCARTAAKSRIDAEFAIVAGGFDLNPPPKIQAKWAKVSMDYDASFRHRPRFFKQCFIDDCGEVTNQIR
jgi:hypothetical protein